MSQLTQTNEIKQKIEDAIYNPIFSLRHVELKKIKGYVEFSIIFAMHFNVELSEFEEILKWVNERFVNYKISEKNDVVEITIEIVDDPIIGLQNSITIIYSKNYKTLRMKENVVLFTPKNK